MKPKKRTIMKSMSAAVAAVILSSAGYSSGQEQGEDVGEKSKHFETVSSHLDLGGEVYLYVDVDGDMSKLADMIGGVIDFANKASRGDMPPELAALDVPGLADQLGLTGIAALGASSQKRGDMYRNTYYLHVPEGRKGLLKLFGGDAKPFASQKLAPSGTDILMEQDIDVKSMYNLLVDLIKEVAGPRAVMEFREETGERIPGTALTIEGIFQSLDTKLIIIGELDTENPLKLPDEVPLKVPGGNLLLALDNVGPIFSKLVMTIPPDHRAAMLEEGDGYQKLTIPVPPEVAAFVQPVIYHDTKSGRVLAATSSTYLEKCLSGETSVWDDPAFAEAMKGLPTEGNAISFVSAKFSKEYLRVYGDVLDLAASEGAMPIGLSEMVVGMMQELGLSPDHSQGAVATNLPDGILIVGNQTVSAKQGVVAMAVASAAMVAGVTFPMYMAKQRRSYEMRREAIEREHRAIERAHGEIEREIEIEREERRRFDDAEPAPPSLRPETP